MRPLAKTFSIQRKSSSRRCISLSLKPFPGCSKCRTHVLKSSSRRIVISRLFNALPSPHSAIRAKARPSNLRIFEQHIRPAEIVNRKRRGECVELRSADVLNKSVMTACSDAGKAWIHGHKTMPASFNERIGAPNLPTFLTIGINKFFEFPSNSSGAS